MDKKDFKIYLAGKMSGLTFQEMQGWRRDLENNTVLSKLTHIINPVKFYSFDNVDQLKATGKEIMDFDLYLVKRSNLVIVNLDYPDSIGTAIELYEAHRKGIPVIGFGTAKNHDWIEACVSKRFDKVEDAVDYILHFYLVN